MDFTVYLRQKRHILQHYFNVDDIDAIAAVGKNYKDVAEEIVKCRDQGALGPVLFDTKAELVAYHLYVSRVTVLLQEVRDESFSEESVDRYTVYCYFLKHIQISFLIRLNSICLLKIEYS